MGLSLHEQASIEKARSVGNSDLSVPLNDKCAAYLCAIIARDLGLQKKIPSLPKKIGEFYSNEPGDSQEIDVPFLPLIEF